MTALPAQQLAAVLERYMPATTARIVMKTCLDSLRTSLEAVSKEDAARLATALITATRHFVRAQDRDGLVAALKAAGGDGGTVEARSIPLAEENDLSAARLAAKDLAERLGASSLQTQKAATAVSELARNVLDYAKRGKVELIPVKGRPSKLRIVVTDEGGGIPNLEQILAGRYRSKTGMGLGLLGVKRMADRFEIQTGGGGTRIEVEFSA